MPLSPFWMQMVTPLGTCDKYAYTRMGEHDGTPPAA
jgi:hypothetical protein